MILEWLFERRPGPVGSVDIAAPDTGSLKLWQLLLRFAFAAIVIATATRLILSSGDRLMPSLTFGLYLVTGYLVRPRPDHSNTGVAGFIDHPLKWSDDANRFLVFLRVVLLPGRLTAAALRDLVAIALGRRRLRNPDGPRRLLTFALFALSLASCAKEGAAPAAQDEPMQVSTAQFQQLRWLEGAWRGTGGGIDAFFEGYRWIDDSTIAKLDYADSTLTETDGGTISLRGNVVRSGSADRSYVVVALDSSSVQFAPERNAANGFEWRRTAPDAWTARLTWDSAGVPRERVYEMRAYRRP